MAGGCWLGGASPGHQGRSVQGRAWARWRCSVARPPRPRAASGEPHALDRAALILRPGGAGRPGGSWGGRGAATSRRPIQRRPEHGRGGAGLGVWAGWRSVPGSGPAPLSYVLVSSGVLPLFLSPPFHLINSQPAKPFALHFSPRPAPPCRTPRPPGGSPPQGLPLRGQLPQSGTWLPGPMLTAENQPSSRHQNPGQPCAWPLPLGRGTAPRGHPCPRAGHLPPAPALLFLAQVDSNTLPRATCRLPPTLSPAPAGTPPPAGCWPSKHTLALSSLLCP